MTMFVFSGARVNIIKVNKQTVICLQNQNRFSVGTGGILKWQDGNVYYRLDDAFGMY